VPGTFRSVATRCRASTRSVLTPCVPVASVLEFQLADSVPQQLCFAFFLPMIAQISHDLSHVPAFLYATNVVSVALKAVIMVMGLRGLKRRGWVVEMTLSCDAWMLVPLTIRIRWINGLWVPSFLASIQAYHIVGNTVLLGQHNLLFLTLTRLHTSTSKLERRIAIAIHHARTYIFPRCIFNPSQYFHTIESKRGKLCHATLALSRLC
jgi:hypothetical protein